jgi:arylformamidase
MEKKVFLHYTQAELDRNFDQRGWAKNALEVIGRYPAMSKATRARLEHQTLAFGPGQDETLDLFPVEGAKAPVQVFVHGGAWRNFTKDDYSFPADSYVPAGVHTVVLNFSNLPKVRLPQMADQVRRGIEWVCRNAASFGGDPERVYLSAHSSGAHLSALALQKDAYVRAATLVSGPYYLEPVVLSARSSYVKLEPQEVVELSPGLHAERLKCPVVIAYAEWDTDEFQRQSREFAAALRRAGRLEAEVRHSRVNHFELMEKFANPDHALVRGILQQMDIERR